MKKSVITIITVLVIPLIILAVFLMSVKLFSYKPKPIEALVAEGAGSVAISGNEFTFFSWNIGYGGLGKEMDFFYEGGKRVRPEEEEFNRYFSGIRDEVSRVDSTDFILLQEVDRHSKRSYYTDEVKEIGKLLTQQAAYFAKNYDSRYVPLPLKSPMGRVVSGIVVFTRIAPVSAERIDFGTAFPWPKQLFFLQRCFIMMKFKLDNGKKLVVINTHNSTFDKEGEMRKEEMAMLEKYAQKEFREGNYVVIGGDWNVNPPDWWTAPLNGNTRPREMKEIFPPLNHNVFSGWHFAFDPAVPTNRDVDGPYMNGKTKTTIIDFFVVSPNIKVMKVETIPLSFENSDHQPVWIKIKIIKDED
ncbi:MAG TPA: endonuclease/exonuclease/phosphatase family protein [Bacteroidales bacterium]|nr:endonuclease/exonuclease/phosphatase family protein [Bacteroidales bacterium]